MKIILLASMFGVLATAQTRNEWDFLTDLSFFRDVHGMLPAYVKVKAFALLDQRELTVARISTMADLKARQQYWRERMWTYLGGQPERTPLNARVVGALDRGDYRIEQVAFESRPGFFVTANLYRPKSGAAPYPAMLYPFGHYRGATPQSSWHRTL